ncbi:MAG: hypothetical protein ACYTE5_01250 [Planctomycetota bacterium]|jgi:hypothetical protein
MIIKRPPHKKDIWLDSGGQPHFHQGSVSCIVIITRYASNIKKKDPCFQGCRREQGLSSFCVRKELFHIIITGYVGDIKKEYGQYDEKRPLL